MRSFAASWTRFIFFLMVTAGTITACGGSGESSSPAAAGSGGSAPVTAANQAPTISGAAATSATVGQAYAFTPSATDPDKDHVTFTISNKPAWTQFDFATGKLSGTPAANDAGSYGDIEIAATDGAKVATLPPFTVTVSRPASAVVAQAVTLEWDPPTANSDGTPLTDLTGYRIHYGSSPGDYSQSLTVSNPGITSYVVDSLPAGKYYFALTAYNARGVDGPYSPEVSATLN